MQVPVHMQLHIPYQRYYILLLVNSITCMVLMHAAQIAPRKHSTDLHNNVSSDVSSFHSHGSTTKFMGVTQVQVVFIPTRKCYSAWYTNSGSMYVLTNI